jgi:hypothetical protein
MQSSDHEAQRPEEAHERAARSRSLNESNRIESICLGIAPLVTGHTVTDTAMRWTRHNTINTHMHTSVATVVVEEAVLDHVQEAFNVYYGIDDYRQ